MKAFTSGPFTGKHITIIMVAFFAVVIAVNVFMARSAISTFGGVVVENSYVASQNYNKWLREAAKEKALGWTVTTRRRADGHLVVTLAGAPANADLSGDAWHPLGRLPDVPMQFARQSDGTFVSDKVLPQGRWQMRLEARAGATRWRAEQEVL